MYLILPARRWVRYGQTHGWWVNTRLTESTQPTPTCKHIIVIMHLGAACDTCVFRRSNLALAPDAVIVIMSAWQLAEHSSSSPLRDHAIVT